MNLRPGLRDNDRGLALPREVEVVGSQPLMLLTKAALDDCAALLKAIKRCGNVSPPAAKRRE
ncbi:MAG TPA: hypothetical protein VGL53_25625 [Bryobacteraceae bacterium]